MRLGTALTTSRPAPERFASIYADAAAAGASGIVSVHPLGRMSGTVDSARLAAAGAAPVPVLVVDTRTVGAGLGFAVLTAGVAARAGGSLAVGGATGLLATTLSVKALMHIVDGQIVPFEKVRTTARAVARLEQLAVEFAGSAPVDVAVQHLANDERAAQLAQHLRARIPGLRSLHISEVGTVIAAHTGLDMLGVVVAPD